MNWSMRSGKYSAMRVVLSKCLKLTLSLVELLPRVPQPSVSDGIRPLVDGQNGLTRDAIKDVEEPGFADLGHGLNGLPLNDEVDDYGCCRQVVVPDIVMHGLKMPESITVTSVESDHGGAEQVIAWTIAAIKVMGGCGHRKVDVAKLSVTTRH